MSVVSSRGSSVVSTSGTTWSGADAATLCDGAVGTNPATYATWVNAARNTSGEVTIGGYTFTGVTADTVINSVNANVRHMESSTSIIHGLTAQLQDSLGNNIGSAVDIARSATITTTNISFATNPTAAQVVSGLQIVVSPDRSSSLTSTTFSLDYVDILVDASIPTVVLPTSATLLLTGGDVGVIKTENVVVQPTSGALSLTGGAVGVERPVLITPNSANLVLTGGVPSAVIGRTIEPLTAELSLLGGTPEIGKSALISTFVGAYIGDVPIKRIYLGDKLLWPNIIEPTAGPTFVLTGGAVNVLRPVVSNPATRNLTLTGGAVNISQPVVSHPASGSLVLTGGAVGVERPVISKPATKSVALTGGAVVISRVPPALYVAQADATYPCLELDAGQSSAFGITWEADTSGSGMAVDSSGNLYLSSNGTSRCVKKLVGTTVSVLPFTTVAGNNMQGLDVDASGNVYLASYSSTYGNRILKLTPGGVETTLPFTLGNQNTTLDVAVDKSSGAVYATDPVGKRVQKLVGTTETTVPFDFGTGVPYTIAVGPDGSLYSHKLYDIIKLDTSNVQTTVLTNIGYNPFFLCVDDEGTLYWSRGGTSAYSKVVKYKDGTQTDIITGLNYGGGVAIGVKH